LRAAGHWRGELWFSRKDGEAFLASVSVSTVDGGADDAKYVALFSDVTEQRRAQELIWRQANFDPVTQLPNRRHFCDSLRAAIVKAETTKTQIAVIFVDLDRFKEVNDRFGHAVGDRLLQQTAERIRSSVRAADLVARLGGDEFTVMLKNVESEEDVERLARRILAALTRTYNLAGSQVLNSASLGVTLYPRDGSDVETLLHNADEAMYAAKRAGRSRLQVFARTLQVGATRADLASDLHRALANNEIELHYQPILEIGSGRVIKAEALARWRHPRLGAVPPSEFIPIAEETGLIVEIGDWVFRRAAAQSLRWRRVFDPQFAVSVNVSAAQLAAQDGAAANFDRLVTRPGLGPGAMIIEVTESALIEASETVCKLVARYRKAGIEIALDNFGTGYSSLAYLKDFDINYLKADRALVSNLAERSREYAICGALVAMAHKLSIRVIAEGVESESQRALLDAAGCDCAQGYLYARPMPAQEFEAMFFGERRALIA
jgi:diguanylate cyclase (GGDEF)-like protein